MRLNISHLLVLAGCNLLAACSTLFSPPSIEDTPATIRALLEPLVPFIEPTAPLDFEQSQILNQRLSAIKEPFENYYASELATCYSRFFVEQCLRPLQSEYRFWKNRIRQLDIRINSIRRDAQIRTQREAIADRMAQKIPEELLNSLGTIEPSNEQIERARRNAILRDKNALIAEEEFLRKQELSDKKKATLEQLIKPK